MKVRILREMPFAKVGEEFDVERINYLKRDPARLNIDFLIAAKWIELIDEPKNLEEEIDKYIYGIMRNCLLEDSKNYANHIVKLAQVYYHDHYKGLFDEATKPGTLIECDDPRTVDIFGYIHKAMFGCDK